MRTSRFTSVLAGVLIALLASGTLRIAHFAIAHSSGSPACQDAYTGCSTNPAPGHRSSPAAPGHPTPSECATCTLLAVLMPDGMPVAHAPFFPASPGTFVALGGDACPSIDHIGLTLARGPPALTHTM